MSKGFNESCAESTTAIIDTIRDIEYSLLDRAEPILVIRPDNFNPKQFLKFLVSRP